MGKYRALLLDVDGTLVPVGPHTKPSQRVIDAITQAQQHVSVSLVSGRPYAWLHETIKYLDIKSPCIANGGTQIIDPQNGSPLWERGLSDSSFKDIMKIIEPGTDILINDSGVEIENPKSVSFKSVLAIQIQHMPKEKTDAYRAKLQGIQDIASHEIYSWSSGQFDIYITHKEATKEHAVLVLAEMLHIKAADMIAVGDGHNDVPLLSACGLKVAMGNAHQELKKIADYIAPSLDEDGVADVVNRFILT